MRTTGILQQIEGRQREARRSLLEGCPARRHGARAEPPPQPGRWQRRRGGGTPQLRDWLGVRDGGKLMGALLAFVLPALVGVGMLVALLQRGAKPTPPAGRNPAGRDRA